MSQAIGLFCLIVISASAAAAEEKPRLPKVILVGDSIRLAYAPLVAKELEGKAVFVSPGDNTMDSKNVLANLEKWVIAEKPDVVYLNCGLHDIRLDRKTKKHQVEPDDYETNLKRIVERIRTETMATLIVALTTPVIDDRHNARRGYDRRDADVKQYNAIATRVCKDAGVAVHDLDQVIVTAGVDKLLGKDGVHFTDEGNKLLAKAVAAELLKVVARDP